MNRTLPETAASQTKAASAPVLTVSYSVVAELTVGCSMVAVMLAYVIFSSGMLNQVI